MRIKVYELDKDFKDAVLVMGGEIEWTNGDGDIDVIFSTKCGVGMATLENDCVGFTNPQNVGFVASSDEFASIEIF